MSELPTGTVTFFFSDIEGSTRLLKTLGRARYGEVLGRHNALLREAFAATEGTEIETQGDSFFAVFRSAAAAVGAAAAAQRALADEDWPQDGVVRVRIGVHTGEAVLGADGYVGFAVHQAARIGDAGHGGQVLLSATTASLVEHDLPAGLSLRDLGEHRLPDLDQAQRLYQLEVQGLPQEFRPIGRRPAAAAPGASPLLERDAEIATIHAVVEMARTGAGRLIAIEGRAGMGKSRLVTEARTSAAEAGMQVLFSRSAELEQDFAYCVVRQLFEGHIATLSDAERTDLFSGTAALTERLFDESQLETAAGSADVSFGILHGLYWLAANVAQRGPTVIAIDDLHWSDAPSLRWLAYLARRLEGLPLLVVLGLRPPEQSHAPELLAEILADPASVVLRPGSLGADSVRALAGEMFKCDPNSTFVEAVHESTGGNPLFVRALLDAAASEGLTPTTTNAGRVREIGPEAVSRAVMLRMARLPEEARAFARAAAILGEGSDLRNVATLAELDNDLAVHAHTTLARADLLRLRTPIEFAHPVIRAAVYETLDPAERTTAHRRAAVLLGETGAPPERVAAHLDLVPPNGDTFVVGVLRQAAERSLAHGAPEAAVNYLRRAVDEPPDPSDRVATLAELGLAERRVDVVASAAHLADAVNQVEDPVERARLALELGRSLFRLNRGPEAVAVFDDALAGLGDAPPDLRNMLEAELINAAGFDPEVIHVVDERIALVREGQLEGGAGRAVMLATLRYFDARRGVNREAVRELGDPAFIGALIESTPSVAISCAATALMYAELDDELDRFFDVVMKASKERGELVTLSNMLSFRGLTFAQRGDLDTAIQDLTESDEMVAYLPTQQGAIYSHSYLADVLTNRGELDEAERTLAELGLGDEVPQSGHMIFFLGARGWVRLARRDLDGSRADFEQLGRLMDRFAMVNPAMLAWRSHLALPLLALDRRADAIALAGEEVELARAWGAPRAIGVALRVQGRAEGGEAGIQTLRESRAVLESSSAKLERARTMVELGSALRRSDQGSEGRDLLREGLELAARSGSQPLIDHAHAELAAAGARPRRLVLTGVESLTASERRVAEMAAQGMTNKDVAQALFVTPKTVEVHLGSVYRKLGIGSRAELGSVLGETVAAAS